MLANIFLLDRGKLGMYLELLSSVSQSDRSYVAVEHITRPYISVLVLYKLLEI